MINSTTGSNINSDQKYLSVEIFQTLSKTAALARTPDNKVIKLETDSEIFYDGKKVAGSYQLIDTYSYITNSYNMKTVPVYTRINKIQDEYGKETYISVEIFQTLSKTEALAWTNDYNVVKLETFSEVYYDGKTITGTFCLSGTYRYTTKKGNEKTVPVYIRASEYKQLTNPK